MPAGANVGRRRQPRRTPPRPGVRERRSYSDQVRSVVHANTTRRARGARERGCRRRRRLRAGGILRRRAAGDRRERDDGRRRRRGRDRVDRDRDRGVSVDHRVGRRDTQLRSERTARSGSGFVAGDGYVVTNQHVVAGATEVKLRFQDNTWYDAEIVGTDAYSDLAVLRAETRPEWATPLSWVDTDPEPPVGTHVMAIGSPYGFSGSASTGIISGVDRVLSAPNNFTVADSVQTDAALNPGNSGGPLVTDDGAVAAVAARGGGDNLGFGVSAELSKRVVPELAETGEYRHPYMGVRLVEVSPVIAEAYDIDDVGGVLIVEVVEDGPAAGALRGTDGSTSVDGVSVPTGGDVIVGIGGTDVEVQADLSNYLALEASPGESVTFTVLRDGSETTVSFELGERPDPGI
ncbi:S1C family serine protease [Halobaculum halobium]|uniref:S1C family serine protease n=1 Tax=Halobaculum halobium TaxID=3032281 RepID=UPI00360C2EB7